MFIPSISKDDLRNLPILQFSGNIHVVDTIQAVTEVCKILINEQALGFDTETKPSFSKGKNNKVALLQLSTNTDAFLFQLKKTGLPPELIQVLSSPGVLKIGAAIHDDIKHLKRVCLFKEDGFVDLQSFVKQFGIENFGLSKLAGIVLKYRISKSQQLSNWENEILSPAQLLYASTDAWAALQIFQELNKALDNA
jgi:ribonuclease D